MKDYLSSSLNLAVIIINYRTGELTCQCLHSLLPEITTLNAEVVVVDNNSVDDSVAKIRDWISIYAKKTPIKLITSPINLGFSGGNNLGIKSVNAKYYLLLNSDTIIRSGAIEKLLWTADLNKLAGLVSPRLEWPTGMAQVSCFRFNSPVCEIISAARTGFISKLFKKYIVPVPIDKEISQQQWVSFACVLVRKSTIEQIGLMDDQFFLYFEDIDYCRRAFLSGWKIIYNPEAHVVHLRGGSASVKKKLANKNRLPAYYYESRSRYYRKYYGLHGLLVANLLWYLGRTISFIRELLEPRNKHVCDKQFIDIWKGFFSANL